MYSVKKLILLFIPLIFSLNIATAQSSKNNINFSLLNFETTNSKIDLEKQELFQSAILSLGDKNIVVEEIIRTILMRPDLSKVDSTINQLLSDFTQEDSIVIRTFLKTNEDWRDEAFYVVMMSYLVQANIDSITLSEAYLNIQKSKPTFFPHKPEEAIIISNPILGLIDKKHSYTKWAVNYPNEYNFFIQLLRQQAKRRYYNDNDLLVNKLLAQVVNNAIENKKVDQESIPMPLKEVLAYYGSTKTKNLKFEELCQPKTIDDFIANAYELIKHEPIPEIVASNINAYVRENEIYDASLIYLAIILSKYE